MNAKDNRKNATFTLTDNRSGDTYDLPVLNGSVGPDVIDVRRLYAETDCFTLTPAIPPLCCNPKSPSSMENRVFCCIAVIR